MILIKFQNLQYMYMYIIFLLLEKLERPRRHLILVLITTLDLRKMLGHVQRLQWMQFINMVWEDAVLDMNMVSETVKK